MGKLRRESEIQTQEQTRRSELADILAAAVTSTAKPFVTSAELTGSLTAIHRLAVDSLISDEGDSPHGRQMVGTVHMKASDKKVYSTELKSARSVKSVNALLRLNKLMTIAAEAVPSAYGVWACYWLAPFAALVLISRIRSLIEIPVEPSHAIVLLTMWRRADESKRLSEDGLLDAANVELEHQNRPRITAEELHEILHWLEARKVIRPVLGSASEWIVEEEISASGMI